MWDEIKKLVVFLNKSQIKKQEIFSLNDFYPKKNKLGEMFDLFLKSEIIDFDSFKKKVGNKVSVDFRTKRLLNRFQDKLYNSLFFTDIKKNKFTEREVAFYECTKRGVLLRKLQSKGMINLAISLAEKTLPNCQKFEFTDLTIMLSKFLMREYGGTLSNQKKYNKYKLIYSHSMEIFIKESILEKYVNEADFFENSSAKKQSIEFYSIDLKIAYNYAIEFSKNFPSIEVLLSSSRIIQYYFSRFKNPELYQQKSDIILKNLQQKEFISSGTMENIIVSKLKYAYLERDFELSAELVNNYLKNFILGNFNWYVANYYFILTSFNSYKYKIGFETLELCLSGKSFSKHPSVIQENFYVLQAYAQYLTLIKKIKLTFDAPIEFRLNKFLNQVPGYSRDKQGINIPIILVQILFLLVNKKYSKIIDRMESLNLYAYRHLKKDENFRSQCFIRMISEMVRADFKKQGTLFRTEKLLNKLKAVPIYTYPATAETEVIPYESLWEMVVESLD